MSSQSDADLRKLLIQFGQDYWAAEEYQSDKTTKELVDAMVQVFQAREYQLLTELMEQLPEKKDINIIGRIGGYSEEPLYVNGVSPHKARANAGYNYAIDQVTALLEQKLQQRNDGGEK